MDFSEIIGHFPTQDFLKKNIDKNRIPHATIFSGPEGCGLLELSLCYANLLLNNKVINKTQHADLHFSYPVAKGEGETKAATSDDYIKEWHEFNKVKPYSTFDDWMQFLDLGKKQGIISVHETALINKKLSLKAYEGGYKVMIIWQADKMNTEAANKLLKNLEEPAEKTVFILVTENINDLLPTIRSRCQEVNLIGFTTENICDYLMQNHACNIAKATKIAQQSAGSLNKALHLFENNSQEEMFEQWFIFWVRAAFKAMKNPGVISDLLQWSAEIAKENRQTQINFLQFCLNFFRQALLQNYGTEKLVYFEPTTENFKLENFAPFVHSNNINEIYKVINDSIYHIERNGSGTMILTDISIKLTRLLHSREEG